MNKTVKVIIDRPLGSYHPKYKEMYYPVKENQVHFQEQYFHSLIEMLI